MSTANRWRLVTGYNSFDVAQKPTLLSKSFTDNSPLRHVKTLPSTQTHLCWQKTHWWMATQHTSSFSSSSLWGTCVREREGKREREGTSKGKAHRYQSITCNVGINSLLELRDSNKKFEKCYVLQKYVNYLLVAFSLKLENERPVSGWWFHISKGLPHEYVNIRRICCCKHLLGIFRNFHQISCITILKT